MRGEKANVWVLSIFSVPLTVLMPSGSVTQGEDRDIGDKVVDKELVQRWKNYTDTGERTV